ncbi:MAG: DnaJ domain-containing protein [Aquihabitans sp.]
MNHYETLGVPAEAEAADIRRAYLAQARRHHPDYHSADDAAVRNSHAHQMQAINEAWAILGSAPSRSEYDATLRSVESPRVRERPDSGLQTPTGKGWTPRSDDDGWQRDFRSWADAEDELAPDEPGAPGPRSPLAVVPVVLFFLGVAAGLLGVVFMSRPLIAACVASVAISVALFLILPLVHMTRGTRDRSTAPSAPPEESRRSGRGATR